MSTVRRNFIAATVLILALLIIIPVITLSMLTQEYDSRIRTETEETSTSIRQTVRAVIDGAYNLSYELAVNPIILTMDGEQQTPILENCVARNDYLELLFIQGTDGNQTARSSGELGYRGGRDWFLKIMEHKQPYVYQSYYSIATGRPVTSVFIPMFDGEDMIGIFGADISLQYFQQLAEEFADDEHGHLTFIIDGEGGVVAHPDITLLETITNFKTQTRTIALTDEYGNRLLNPDGSDVTEEQEFILSDAYKHVIEDVMAGNRGLDIIEIDGIIYYASYESIEMPGYSDAWSVITLQNREIAMSAIYDLMLRVLIIIAVIFTVFIIIAVIYFKSLNRTMSSLETAKSEAEEANKSKSAFLSTMSHEIRTPMNAILGITEILLHRDDINTDVRTALERTYSSGNMLLGIINDILDLSKIEAGKLELILGKYEIASLISDTTQLNMMRIGSKPIEFELNADKLLPKEILGDELRVKQIFNNLLSNAFKYTEKGKVTLDVRAEQCGGQFDNTGQSGRFDGESQSKEEVYLVFKVSDTGQGMTKEQVSMLFGEYTRFNMEANRKTEGTGLGLSIAYKLIQMMDGDISVESEPGVGTTFTARIKQGRIGTEILGNEMSENLRRFRVNSAAQLRKTEIKREPMPYGSVMIVDDVETNIYVAQGLLSPYGMLIDSADSGAAAIEKLKNGNVYDIVFMDHMMPDMDGIEATKRIREMGYKHPIVALTANAVAGQAEMFLSSGFDDFISKPIDMRQMNAILNKLIRDKQPPEVIEAARISSLASISGGGVSANEKDDSNPIDSGMIKIFLRDANKAIAILDNIMEKAASQGETQTETQNVSLDKEDLRSFTINVHGLKSTLAVIGKPELSDTARELETMGRDENAAAIAGQAPQFLDALRTLIEELSKTVEDEITGEAGSSENLQDSDIGFLQERLGIIKAACEEFDNDTADKALEELKAKTWSKKTGELIDKISEHLLHSDFDEIVSLIEKEEK